MSGFPQIAMRANWVLVGMAILAMAGCGGKDEPKPVPEGTRILLRDGDRLGPDFEILTIESANMAADRSISFIASRTGTDNLQGVFYRTPEGQIRTVLSPDSNLLGSVPTDRIRKLNMAQSGEFAFSVGDRLDSDAVFYSDGQDTRLLATTDSNDPLSEFRILGQLRVEEGGAVAFSDGSTPCSVDTSGGDQRIRCTLRLQYGPPGDIRQVELPNDLSGQNPTSIILQVNENNQAVVGLPARGDEPVVGLLENGSFEGVLFRREQIFEYGILTNAKPRAIGNDGTLAIDASFDTDLDNDRDTDRVLRYRDGGLDLAASTGDAIPYGKKEITGLNAVAVDDIGRMYYVAEYLGSEGERDLLRVWDGVTNTDIIWLRKNYGGKTDLGEELQVTSIEQTRVFGDGTVLLVVTIGFYEEGTRRITSRQLLRWKNGKLDTLFESKSNIEGGSLVGFDIADLNQNGDLLLIVNIDRRANRALMLIPREEVLLP